MDRDGWLACLILRETVRGSVQVPGITCLVKKKGEGLKKQGEG